MLKSHKGILYVQMSREYPRVRQLPPPRQTVEDFNAESDAPSDLRVSNTICFLRLV